MSETAQEQPVHVIDCRNLRCPMPFIHSKREAVQMKTGDRLEILVTDENTVDTVGMLAKQEHMNFRFEQMEDHIKITLSKGD